MIGSFKFLKIEVPKLCALIFLLVKKKNFLPWIKNSS